MNNSTVIDFEVQTGAITAKIEFLKPLTIHNRAYSYGYEPGDHEPPPTATFAAHRVVIRTRARKLGSYRSTSTVRHL